MMRRPPTLARGGMVVASHPLAAEAGVAMLRAGGHAVDAAVAAGAVLAVVEPSASGLGGDAFLLVHDRADGAVTAINGSGAAPRRLSRETFAGLPSIPARGPLSASIPGCVDAWGEAWYGWGRLEWKQLFSPALSLAQEGFPVSWRMGRILRNERETLAADPQLARIYLHPDGRPLAAGEICRSGALGMTMKLLAEEGARGFYSGRLAEKLCRGVRAAGGVIDPADLNDHESQLLAPHEQALDGFTLCEQPLPSQGILLALLLSLMAEGDHSRREQTSPWLELHRQVEAAKIAFSLRDALLADPRHLPVPEEDLVSLLLAPETIRGLSRLPEEDYLVQSLTPEVVLKVLRESSSAALLLIARYHAAGYSIPGLADGVKGSDTTYLCTMDAQGNAAGLIQSIFRPFGCGFLEPSTGILLNNRASAFSLDPRHVNRLEPGKRALHTLNSYMVLRDGRPWLIGGTPGADHQVQTSLQVLRHILGGPRWPGPQPMIAGRWTQARRLATDRQRLPEPELLCAALEAPRWGLRPDGAVLMESRFPGEVPRRLRKLGHPVSRLGPWEGSGLVQAIRCLEDGVCLGATDPRGEGAALGL